MKYIQHFFKMRHDAVDVIRKMTPDFGYDGYGEFVFWRTYSRLKLDGSNESWADVVIRVTEGVMSIRKNHYIHNNIEWDEVRWQNFAFRLAESMFRMTWLPPGRGLWAMGTNFVAERGAMSLYNCAYTELRALTFADDVRWFMDALMNGVGVGFKPIRDDLPCTVGLTRKWSTFTIPDSREGWAQSVEQLILFWTTPNQGTAHFDYSQIRKKGEAIKGFGGTASGPESLRTLHEQISVEFYNYHHKKIDVVELKTNIVNQVGCCVIAGNTRRSAELGMLSITDPTFLDLKDYDKHPDRKAYGWMSNNTVTLDDNSDFEMLGEVAKRVPVRGEPGIANLRNFEYGRIGKRKYPVRRDLATGLNPCGEITLEHREVCNLAETYPTRCVNEFEWQSACKFAAFYCSTVSLLPTHEPSTNAVVMRNRRIGVGIVDYTGWKALTSLNHVIAQLNIGYKLVRKTNCVFNMEAGVPEAIKVTTVKPGGTTPKLAGRVSGMSYPTFNETLRRTRVAADWPGVPLLKEAGVPYVVDRFDPDTLIFGHPILQKGRPAEGVSLWEQAFDLITLQRHWSDNAVSNTLYFKPKWRLVKNCKVPVDYRVHLIHYLLEEDLVDEVLDNGTYLSEGLKITIGDDGWGGHELNVYVYDPNHEEDIIENVLAHLAPHIKSCSLLPHSAKGAYENMPEEGMSRIEYEELKANIKPVDWSRLSGSDGVDEKFCQGESCQVPMEKRTT